jgi:hypothetical protein
LSPAQVPILGIYNNNKLLILLFFLDIFILRIDEIIKINLIISVNHEFNHNHLIRLGLYIKNYREKFNLILFKI